MQRAGTVGTATRRTMRHRLGLSYRGGASAYLFVLPSITFISIFVIIPIIGALYYSFHNYDLLTAPEWAGFKNYLAIRKDPQFLPAIRNTIMFAFGTVPAVDHFHQHICDHPDHWRPLLFVSQLRPPDRAGMGGF